MLRIAKEALTFDDVLLVPGHSAILPHEANLKTRLTRNIELNIPMVSSAMDTVTESRLAIALAQEGGLGFIHKNMSIEAQANEVRRVKKFEAGVVSDPVTVSTAINVGEVMAMADEHGFSGFPVVDKDNNLQGIVTGRDLRFEANLKTNVTSIMTPKARLITVKEGAANEVVFKLMHENRIEKILVVDDEFKLKGMITVKDFQKADSKPNACKDSLGRLRVGAAVGVGAGTDERIEALVAAGVDVLLIDTSHGHSQGVLDRVAKTRAAYPDLDIVGGNVATRIVTGCGVPQITAISDAVEAVAGKDVPVIADGGIRFSGDISKALVAGASCVMVGSMLAGTEEAPGEVELYQGRYYKSYRGMGSLGAMNQSHGSSDRYFQKSDNKEKLVPEGIEGRVAYKGPIENIIHQQLGGIRSAMGLTGCGSIPELNTKPVFVRVTSAGMGESHVHDVQITKEAPNYRMG